MKRSFWKLLFQTHLRTKSATVRYAFPIVMLATFFAGLASVITQDSSYVSIETTPASVREGEYFFITILANAHTPVNAIDISLSYPESLMEVESIDTGTSVITLWTETPSAKNGTIQLRGGTFRKGFVGEHEIARVTARARATGIAYLTTNDVTFVAGDGLGTVVDVTDIGSEKVTIPINAGEGSLVGDVALSIVTDIDGNGTVDLRDISAFMGAWFTRGKTFDFNGDGRMTFIDFSILLADSFFK